MISIPAWEEEAGRPFLVHGESIMRILTETASAADQENRKKNVPRAGSVPPRSTTPVNSSNHYVPGSGPYGVSSGKGVVTPAVRSGSAMGGTSNKRPRLGDAPSGGQGRAVLGAHRSNTNGHRVASPSKISGPTKTPGSSLPRPVTVSLSMHMPIPKPGTQHHALGHGRVPSGMEVSTGYGQRNFSSAGSRGYGVAATVQSKKVSRARRESFKPRPSVDDWEHGHGSKWGGFAGASVKEEEEG